MLAAGLAPRLGRAVTGCCASGVVTAFSQTAQSEPRTE